MSQKLWEADEIRELRALRAKGRTTRQIAYRLRRSYDSVRSKIRELRLGHGLTEIRRGRNQRIAELRAQGWSFRRIATHLNIGVGVISGLAHRGEIPEPKRAA